MKPPPGMARATISSCCPRGHREYATKILEAIAVQVDGEHAGRGRCAAHDWRRFREHDAVPAQRRRAAAVHAEPPVRARVPAGATGAVGPKVDAGAAAARGAGEGADVDAGAGPADRGGGAGVPAGAAARAVECEVDEASPQLVVPARAQPSTQVPDRQTAVAAQAVPHAPQ